MDSEATDATSRWYYLQEEPESDAEEAPIVPKWAGKELAEHQTEHSRSLRQGGSSQSQPHRSLLDRGNCSNNSNQQGSLTQWSISELPSEFFHSLTPQPFSMAESSDTRCRTDGASAGSDGSSNVQLQPRELAPEESQEELSPMSSPGGHHYSDDAWKSETSGTDGLSEYAMDQTGGHGDSTTSSYSMVLHSAISEISKEYLSGQGRTGQNLSENDSSDISSDGDPKLQDRSGHYPETTAGLSDTDWNPYGTGPESDTNCTPRVSGRDRPSRVSADGDSGASKESTLPSYSAFDPLRTSSKVNDANASCFDGAGLSLTENASGGKGGVGQTLPLPSIPEFIGENHSNSAVDQDGTRSLQTAGAAWCRYGVGERRYEGKEAGLRSHDALPANQRPEDIYPANQQGPDSRGPSPAISSGSASTASTVKELQVPPATRPQSDSRKASAPSADLQSERVRNAKDDFAHPEDRPGVPESVPVYMSVGQRERLLRASLSPTQLSEEALAWRAARFLEEVDQNGEVARPSAQRLSRHSFPPESQSQERSRRDGATGGEAVRSSVVAASLPQQRPLASVASQSQGAGYSLSQASASTASTASSSRQAELARARGVPDGVVGRADPIWSKSSNSGSSTGDGGARLQSLQDRQAAAAGDGSTTGNARPGVPQSDSKTSAASGGGLAGLQTLTDAYKRRAETLESSSAQSSASASAKPSQAVYSISSQASLNVAVSQTSFARMTSPGSGQPWRAQPPDLRGSVRDSSLVCRTSEIGRGQQEASQREGGGQGLGAQRGGGQELGVQRGGGQGLGIQRDGGQGLGIQRDGGQGLGIQRGGGQGLGIQRDGSQGFGIQRDGVQGLGVQRGGGQGVGVQRGGGQGVGDQRGGGADRDSLDARVKLVLSEVSYLDSYKQVLANSQAAGYGYLSRCRAGGGAPGSLDYDQLHLDLTEIQSSLDAPHPPPGPPADTPTPGGSEAGSEAVPSTSTTPDRNRRLLWDYGADLEYDETGRFVGNPDRPEEMGRGQVSRGHQRSRPQYNSEGEETRGSGSTKADDQSSEGSHRSDEQVLDFLGSLNPCHAPLSDGDTGMVGRVADILRRENPDAQALAILQEVQAQERELLSSIILQSQMNASYSGQSSMELSSLNNTLTDEDVKRRLFHSELSSPNASAVARSDPPLPPTSREMAVPKFSREVMSKVSGTAAFSSAHSLISSQMSKVADRSFNHSVEFQTPFRRDVVCYPVFGRDRGPGQGEGGQEKGQRSAENDQRAAVGGSSEGQSRTSERNPQLLQEFPVRDRDTFPDNPPEEAWQASPSTGRMAEESSGSQDQSDMAGTSPSSYSASSPGDSDLSGGRMRDRLRPYKPGGIGYMYYTESDTGSVADSVTTMESTHTGSDDAIGPAFPPHILGSRQPAPVAQGLYHKSRLATGTVESALPTIEEKSSERSSYDDTHRSSGDNGSHDGQATSKTPPADTGAPSRLPEGRGTEVSWSSQGNNNSQGATQLQSEASGAPGAARPSEEDRGGERDRARSDLGRPEQRAWSQQVRREPLGSGIADSNAERSAEPRRQEADPDRGRDASDAQAGNGGQVGDRAEEAGFGRDRGSTRLPEPEFGRAARGTRDGPSPGATDQLQEELLAGGDWERRLEDRTEGLPSRLVPARWAWQEEQGPQELPPNLDRDPRLFRRSPPQERRASPVQRRLSSSPMHEGRSPGPSPHSSPIPFQQHPQHQVTEPLEHLPNGVEDLESHQARREPRRRNRVDFLEAEAGGTRREEAAEAGGSLQDPPWRHATEPRSSGAMVDDELSDSDPALALDREPLNQRVRLLQQALEQEFDPALPPNLEALWSQFANLNASTADTTSTLDSSRLSHLADLLRNPSRHLVRNFLSEREAARQQELLAQEELAAQAREERRQELQRLSTGGLSEEEVNGSYGEFLHAPPHRADRQATSPKKQMSASHREQVPRVNGHSETIDTLYSIPEDTGLNGSSPLFRPELPLPTDNGQGHVIDPHMLKLRTKIQQQKDKIERERRKELRRLQKLMRLEQLLKGKRRGLVSEVALAQQLAAISTTSASSDSELVSDSTLAPTFSSNSLTEDSSTTAKDSSTEMTGGKGRGKSVLMEDAYVEALDRMKRKTAGTQTRPAPLPDRRSTKEEKLRLNEKLRIISEMQRQRQDREKTSASSDHSLRKLAQTRVNEERQMKRDASTMYPTPDRGGKVRDKGRRVRMASSGVQTTPGLQTKSRSPTVPALALHRSQSQSGSPSRSPAHSSALRLARSRSPQHPRPHPRPSSLSPEARRKKSNSRSPHRPSSMFIPEMLENVQPFKKKAKKKATKPKIVPPSVAWYIPAEEARPWQRPLSEIQAQVPPPKERPNDGKDPWRPEGVSLHLLQDLVASQKTLAERKRLIGDECEEEMEEASTDYSTVENRMKKPIGKMSLQEAFKVFKQDFISHSRERDKRRHLAAEERRLQENLKAEQERIFQDCHRLEANVHAHPMADLHYKPRRRVFTMREMKEMALKKYKKLPEVVEKEKDRKRRDVYLMNRIRARIFNKKVQRTVLQRAGCRR